jgi:hypothetical protein
MRGLVGANAPPEPDTTHPLYLNMHACALLPEEHMRTLKFGCAQ